MEDFRALLRFTVIQGNLISLLIWIWIPLFTLPLEGKLLGDHICQTDIIVPQEVLKWELKNRTTRTYKWCMSVPPRCSVYSNRLVNETKIAVINITKQIETCCEGFMEQNHFCVTLCKNCQKGLCIKGTCVCQIGWSGPQCDSQIKSAANVPLTSTKLSITQTTPVKFLTATNINLQSTLLDKYTTTPIYSHNDYQTSSQKPSTVVDKTLPNTKKVLPIIDTWDDHNNSLELYSLQPQSPTTTTNKIITTRQTLLDEVMNLYRKYLSTTPKTTTLDLISPIEEEGSGSRYKENSKGDSIESFTFETTVTPKERISLPTKFLEDLEDFESKEKIDKDIDGSDIDYRELDRRILDSDFSNNTLNGLYKTGEETHKHVKEISSTSPTLNPTNHDINIINQEEEKNTIVKENILGDVDDFSEGTFERRSSMENLKQNSEMSLSEPASKNLIYSICAASLTTFLILVAVVTMYAVRNSKEKVEKSKAKKDIATVAVYTTSIFHSPLPDPPTFDNPTYLATSPRNGHSWNEARHETIEVQEFNVVFQKPMRNPKLGAKQYVYDHPPSTGSYRASSEIDTLSQYNFSQRSGIVLEPLYDEIPSKDGQTDQLDELTISNVDEKSAAIVNNIDHNCLYMNTCGRTMF